MTQLTKADIDAIVSRFESCGGDRVLVGPESVDEAWLRRTLYRAAGLQADGSAKPEKVRVDMVVNPEYPSNRHFWESPSGGMYPDHYHVTPGTFTPDGAE